MGCLQHAFREKKSVWAWCVSPLSLSTQWRAPSCRCHRSGLAPAERCRCDARDPLRPSDRLRPQHFGRATSRLVWRQATRSASPRRCNPAPRCGRRAIRRLPPDPPRPRSPRRCAATGRDFWCATVLTWDARPQPLPAVRAHWVRVPPAMVRACGAGLLALLTYAARTARCHWPALLHPTRLQVPHSVLGPTEDFEASLAGLYPPSDVAPPSPEPTPRSGAGLDSLASSPQRPPVRSSGFSRSSAGHPPTTRELEAARKEHRESETPAQAAGLHCFYLLRAIAHSLLPTAYCSLLTADSSLLRRRWQSGGSWRRRRRRWR